MPQVPMQDAPSIGMTTQTPTGFNVGADVKQGENFAPKQMQQFGQAASSAANDVFKIATKLQNEVDDARSNEAVNSLYQKTTEIERNYLSMNGRQAIDGFNNARDSLAQAITDIEGTLTNDTQRKVFSAQANRVLISSSDRLIKHSISEQKSYSVEQSKARIKTNIDAAGRYYLDSGSIPGGDFDVYAGSAVRETERLADSMGASPDVRAQMVADTKTAIHTLSSQSLIDSKQYDEAVQYLEDAFAAGEMGPQAYHQQMKVAEAGRSKMFSINVSESVMNEFANKDETKESDPQYSALGVNVPSLSKVVQEISNRIVDPDERKAAISHATQQHALLVAQFKDAYADNFYSAQEIAFTKGYSEVPVEALAKLTTEDRNKLIVGPERVDTPSVVLEIMQDPSLMKKEKLDAYRYKLSEATYLKFLKQGSSDDAVRAASIDTEQLNKSLVDAGFFNLVKPDSDREKKESINLRLLIQERIDREQETEGRKLRLVEKQRIVNEIILDKVKKRNENWLDSEKTLFQLDKKDMENAYVVVDSGEEIKVGLIPADVRVSIMKALRKNGQPISEQAIANAWVIGGKPLKVE